MVKNRMNVKHISSLEVPLCILLLFLATFLAASPKALASSAVRVYLEPSNYVFSPENASVGTLFNVTVWVSSDLYPLNLMMWQVYIEFNNTMIMPVFYESEAWGEKIPLLWPNDDMDGRAFDTHYVFYNKKGGQIAKPSYYDRGGGLGGLKHCDTLATDASINAPKILCVIEFNITAVPADGILSCALKIDNEHTFLYDSNGPIPYEVVKNNGTYMFIPEFSILALITLAAATITTIANKKLQKIPKTR
jgi:hypothetical protein